MSQQKLFNRLRKKYPVLSYEEYRVTEDGGKIYIHFFYNLGPDISFQHEINLLKKGFIKNLSLADPSLQNAAFQLGLIELIRYWKLTCSPTVILRAGALSSGQISWWKKLFFCGLQEFFHIHSINTDLDHFMRLEVASAQTFPKFERSLAEEKQLIPVGGGKDSIVTLELLSPFQAHNFCLIVNPQKARLESAKIAGYSSQDIIEVRRIHDKQLNSLSTQGFLNGHCPFSAFLSFLSFFVATLFSLKNIIVSHESSANEENIPGSGINHQYSKSFLFEQDVNAYLHQYLTDDVQYFSILRPFNELQIAKYFSRLSPRYLEEFRSCNRLSGQNRWCGKCAKCLFVQIILYPFLDEARLFAIFGSSLFFDAELLPIFLQLIGIDPVKPFECVGTREEVNAALSLGLARQGKENKREELPYLLKVYSEKYQHLMMNTVQVKEVLTAYNKEHLIPEKFSALLDGLL
jgi:hypothetical protein